MGISVGRAGSVALPQAAWLGLAIMAGLGAGVLLGIGGEAGHDPALVTLLRFMAVVKAAMVAGVATGAAWRLRMPAGPGTALGYAAACGIMAAGLWPIWAATHVTAGAALVHGGFAVAIATGWRDRAAWQIALAARRA